MNGESYNGYGYNENGTERERDDLEANEYSSNDIPNYSTLDSYEETQKQQEQEYEDAENEEYLDNQEKALEKVREAREEMADLNKKLDEIENGIRGMMQNIGAQSLKSLDETKEDISAQSLSEFGLTEDGNVAPQERIRAIDKE
ncbi:hypothetical protein IKD57_01560 [Candidatus Saccharibacteria bacterium]|nr:hypothetical protein [Candidatus Saccharibacteria bacterium]